MKTLSAGLPIIGLFLILFLSCQNLIGDATEAPPVLGQASVEIPKSSSLINQSGLAHSESNQEKIQVVDFFLRVAQPFVLK